MKIQVKLFATLRKYLPGLPYGEAAQVELPDGSSMQDLVERLKLPAEDVKICFVNNCIVGVEKILADGDEVGIFPPVGGG